MNSEQKTFSTRSLTLPAITTSLMLSAGAFFSSPAIAVPNCPYTPPYQHIVGINDFSTSYIQVGSITSSSGEVEIVNNKLYPEEQPWMNFEIDTALNVIQKLSFLEVDEEIDRKIDSYFGSKPLNSKKIYIAKHNR